MQQYDLKLSDQELSVIFQGLGELPLKQSVTLFAKLQNEQIKQDREKAIPIEGVFEDGN